MTNIQTCDFSFLIAIKSGQWFVLIKILGLSVRFLTYLFDSFFQLPDRFKFAPEMEAYVDAFLNSCDDPERQLAVMIGFSTLTNQGYPVVPSIWRVVRHLQPVALQKYIDWLKDMFLRPDLSCCLDFSTSRQKQNPENVNKWVCWWCTFFFFLSVCGWSSYLCEVRVGQPEFGGSLAMSWQLFPVPFPLSQKVQAQHLTLLLRQN